MMGDQIVIVPEQHQHPKEDKIISDNFFELSNQCNESLHNERNSEDPSLHRNINVCNFVDNQKDDFRKEEDKKSVIPKNYVNSESEVENFQISNEISDHVSDIKLSENHRIKNEHPSFPSVLLAQFDDFKRINGLSETERSESSDTVVFANSVELYKPRTVSTDFLPIHFGKWSKVICELRHRFGIQVCHDDAKKSDVLNFILMAEQTIPKTIQKAFISVENDPKDRNQVATVESNGLMSNENVISISEEQQAVTEIRSCENLIVITDENSENNRDDVKIQTQHLLLAPISSVKRDKSSEKRASSSGKEIAICHIDKSKVSLDFATRLLYCDTCLTTFISIDEALAHFKTDQDSDKSADQYTWDEYDINQIKCSDEKLQLCLQDDSSPKDYTNPAMAVNREDQKTGQTIRLNANQNTEKEEDLTQNSSNKSPEELENIAPISKLNWDDQHENDSLNSYSEKIPLFEKNNEDKRNRKRKKKKKKKKKAWKIVKRSLIYTIAFLF